MTLLEAASPTATSDNAALESAAPFAGAGPRERSQMKVRPSVKKMCDKCKVIRRHGAVRVICVDPRHKQRQG